MIRLLLVIVFLLINSNLYASDWKNSFFTDDSSYYLKLFSNGLQQRFRVSKEHCHQLKSADIIFNKNSNQLETMVEKMTLDGLSNNWPDLYGIEESNYCWFQLTVKGINLNHPRENKYLIQINLVDGPSYYFTGVKNSIIPSKRLKKDLKLNDFNWIDLGALGTTEVEDGGIFFKLWEPIADKVDLIIEGRANPISLIADNEKRIEIRNHVIYLPKAQLNLKYHYSFIKNGTYEVLNQSALGVPDSVKIDPMSKGLYYQKRGGKYNAYLNPRSIITKYPKLNWKNDDFLNSFSKIEINNWIIYQLWPLVFNPKKDLDGKYRSGTFNTIKEKIDYLAGLGVTAVEFLPIHPTRFNGSTGYAHDSILLIEKNYGTAADLMRLVDSLHGKKIRVILDVVLNHMNNFLIRDPISEKITQSKYYKGRSSLGPMFNFDNIMVQKWIIDSLRSLIRDFHIDGFKFDTIEKIFKNNPLGFVFLQEVNLLLKLDNPNFYSAALQLPDDVWVSKPVNQQGIGFDSQWNEKFKSFFEHGLNSYRLHDQQVDLTMLEASLLGLSSHGHYSGEFNFGDPRRTVNYLGSYNLIECKDPILRIVSDYQGLEWSSDWNKNHSTEHQFVRVRPLEDPKDTFNVFRQIHNSFTHAVGRLSYGTLFTKPGAVLFFQGEELASDLHLQNEWYYMGGKNIDSPPTDNLDLHRYISSHRMPWEYLNPQPEGVLRFLTNSERNLFSGYHKFFKDMIKFKINNPALNLLDAKNINITHDGTMISYQLSVSIDDEYFIVSNFGNNKEGAWITFPLGTDIWWEEMINSSSNKYSGSSNVATNIISNLGGRTNYIRICQSCMMIFKKKMVGRIKRPLYLMGNINKWKANKNFKLKNMSDRGEIYGVIFEVLDEGDYQFKLATSNWIIELGFISALERPLRSFGRDKVGILGYQQSLPNLKIKLAKGSYKFLFNLVTFKYKFIKL